MPYSVSSSVSELLEGTTRVGPGLSFAVADQGADRAMQSMASWLNPGSSSSFGVGSASELLCGDVLIDQVDHVGAGNDRLEITPTNAFLDAIDAGLIPEPSSPRSYADATEAQARGLNDAIMRSIEQHDDTSDPKKGVQRGAEAWLSLLLTGAGTGNAGTGASTLLDTTAHYTGNDVLAPTHSLVRHARIRASLSKAIESDRVEADIRSAGVGAEALSASAKRFRQEHAQGVAAAVGMRIDVLGGIFDGRDVSIRILQGDDRFSSNAGTAAST